MTRKVHGGEGIVTSEMGKAPGMHGVPKTVNYMVEEGESD